MVRPIRFDQGDPTRKAASIAGQDRRPERVIASMVKPVHGIARRQVQSK
jgi:hypothetical protein